MKKSFIILFMLCATSAFAQQRGTFSDESQIRANTSTSTADTAMIATLSFEYPGWPTMTIYYKFLDSGTVATTMYIEARVTGKLFQSKYAVVDSLVVSAVTGDSLRVWNITDAAIGVTEQWRLRKSVNTDTLVAIFKGYNGNLSK